MATVGRRLLSAIVQAGSVQTYLKLSLDAYLFRESEVELYEAINTHVSKFGKIPSEATLKDKDFGDVLVDAPEPPEYYMEEVEKRYLRSSLKTIVVEANQMLVDEEETEAYDHIMTTLANVHKKRNRKNLFDFRESHNLVWGEYIKQKTMGDDYALKFGWPKVDEMTGGMKGGDFVTFVGRPASGKTFKLLYIAYNSWRQGRVPLFVSMEMNTTIIAQRLATMHTQQNLTNLLKAQMSTAASKQLKAGLTQAGTAENPLWVVDGNLTSTVEDVIMLCRQLGVTDVYVDGAYLLRHPNAKIGKWDKMSENAEWLKQKVAQDLNLPVVASYQFSKDSKKKKHGNKDEEAGLEDIYGSDAIAQLSTIVMGLFQPEGIETQHQRDVNIMKGRNGEKGRFSIHWDFNKMDFSQVLEKSDKQAASPDLPQEGSDDLIYL